MKKAAYLFIIIFTFTIYSAAAQIKSLIKKIDAIEFMAGPSYVTMQNKNLNSGGLETKIEYAARIGFQSNINNIFSIVSYLSFEKKGHRRRRNILYYNAAIDTDNCGCTFSKGVYENELSLTYLSFAPVFNIKFYDKFSFGIGPAIGKLIKYKLEITHFWERFYWFSRDWKNISTYDFGILSIINYTFRIKENINSTISIQNQYGLINTSQHPGADKTINNSISMLLGITYVIPK